MANAPGNIPVKPRPAVSPAGSRPVAVAEVMYAGFWRRFVAMLIDSVVITLAGIILIITILGYASVLGAADTGDAGTGGIGIDILWLSLPWLYYAGMESSGKQATIGKMILGLQVCDLDGNRISFMRATGRYAAKFLSYITLLIGFVMAGFTEKKQALHDIVASCLVVKRTESHFLKLVFAGLIAFLLLVGGIGTYVYYFFWKQVKEEFNTTLEDPGKAFEPSAVTEEKTVPKSAPPANLDEAAYDKLLSSSFTQADYDKLFSKTGSLFDKGPNVHAGPAVLELSTFFTNSVWVKVYMPPVPNLDSDLATCVITVDKVLDDHNKDFYDAGSSFENDLFFQRVNLSKQTDPFVHFAGQRTVHLLPGIASEESLQSIQGKLALTLPVGINTVTFKSGELNQVKEAGAAKVMLKTVDGNKVTVHYTGLARNYLGMKAFNAADQELESTGRSMPPEQETIDTDLQANYEGNPARIEILIAANIIQREYPFVLKK